MPTIADLSKAAVLLGEAARLSMAEAMEMLSVASRQMFSAKRAPIVGYGHRGRWNR